MGQQSQTENYAVYRVEDATEKSINTTRSRVVVQIESIELRYNGQNPDDHFVKIKVLVFDGIYC